MTEREANPTYARVLALSFLAGAAIMAAELAAPRLTAPYLGVTVLSWNAIFAVFLAAIALGNLIGGRLADRARPHLLAWLFGVAALLIALAVPLDRWMRGGGLDGVPHTARILVAITLAFAPGALAFGMIGPALARAALGASERSGRALGMVGGMSALGSVCGTFITGFLLVPHVGTTSIYLGAGALLLLCVPMARGIPLGIRETRTPLGEKPVDGAWTRLAFLAGASFLAVEIIAARVAANRLGTSIYTWTSVLGVLLVALAVGNAIGGRLADRFEPTSLLRRLFLVASVAVATCLWTPALTSYVTGMDLSWMLRSLLAVAAGFFLPGVAVGTLTPVIIRAALGAPGADGRTVGRLYAFGTLGAVVGALVPTFLFIPGLGVPSCIAFIAFYLALAPIWVGGRVELPWALCLVAVTIMAGGPWQPADPVSLRLGLREDGPGVHVEDSPYFHIRVEDHDVRWVPMDAREKLDARYIANDPLLKDQLSFDTAKRLILWRGPMSEAQADKLRAGVLDPGNRLAVEALIERCKHRVKLLSLDRFVHGFADLEDPLWLEYEYEILQAGLLRALWPATGTVKTFFIGGGAYTFQRRLAKLYSPRIRIVTAEIDPAVTAVAQAHLGLDLTAGHTIRHTDARTALRRTPQGQTFDFVFGDAFHDLGVPWHLTTREFAEEIKARLSDRGIYVVNMIDAFRYGRFLGAFVGTLESVFKHVRVLGMGPRDDDTQQTFLLLASDGPLVFETLTDDRLEPLDVVHYSKEDLAAAKRRAGGLILTDDHAPVEDLLAPVVRLRAAGGSRSRR